MGLTANTRHVYFDGRSPLAVSINERPFATHSTHHIEGNSATCCRTESTNMDFSHLQSLQHELNSTDTTAYNLPSTLLELVVPGYSTISQLAFRLLGIDIGAIVSRPRKEDLF